MISFFLYIIILAGGAGAGYLAARPFVNRVIHLDDLIITLKTLQSEMEYRGDPLPALLLRIANDTGGKPGEFFLRVLTLIEENKGMDFYRSWEKAVYEAYSDSALKEDDRLILSQVGIELGKTGIENQQALFAHAFTGLERQRKEADEERRSRGRVYRTLGTAAGILAVIVLL
ncbi:hypothetical protein MASR2M70_01970 [Bacillota bacterium]